MFLLLKHIRDWSFFDLERETRRATGCTSSSLGNRSREGARTPDPWTIGPGRVEPESH